MSVTLQAAVQNFRGVAGTFSVNSDGGQPSPFLLDALMHPVDILDHFEYNSKFQYLDFIRMQ